MIDAHHHLWDIAARDHRWLMGNQPWATDAELARLRRSFLLTEFASLAAAAGVTGSVVIQTVTEPWETPDLLALASGLDPYTVGQATRLAVAEDAPLPAQGLLVGVVGWTDLAAPAVADEVERLRELPGGRFLRGIRHPIMAEPDADWLSRDPVLRGMRALAAAGLSFDLMMPPDLLPAAITAARSVPELTFVLDHLGGPPVSSARGANSGPWADAIRKLAALPNVACKLSGMHTDQPDAGALRPYYDTVLAAFGPDRLLFGSDWPVCTLAATYSHVLDLYERLTAQLSAAERQAIFDQTARRVYQLS